MTGTVVTEPGVYTMPAEVYHADPVPGGSLSASGGRKLLPPSCPALFAYERDNPPPPTAEFSLGHAAHRLVLGVGPDIVEVDAGDWRTKVAREQRDEAHDAGLVPLLRHEYEQVKAMAAALRAHPLAAALLQPGTGEAEQSLFWQDHTTGVWRRARPDWLPHPRSSGRSILVDYKTCRCAAPDQLQRVIHDYGYHQQAAWYLDGAIRLGLAGQDAAFLLLFQEKVRPFLVTVVEPDAMALRIGRHLNRQAIDTYTRCTQTGHWPGYTDDIAHVGVPAWVENRHLEETS